MYHWYQWLAFFFIYGFFGWIWETAYVSIGKRCFVNRGFLHGPIIPIYAFGALSMLILALPVKDNMAVSYVVGVLGTTLLELVTGWAMEKIFRVRYWDYRYRKIQFRGYISLVSSLFWGVLTVVLVNWMHPPIEEFILQWNTNALIAVDLVIGAVFLTDFVISTKQALDLRKVLVSLEKLYAEMEAVQRELAAHLEESKERMDQRIAQSKERMDERIAQSREKWDEYREMAATRVESGIGTVADRMEESRQRMDVAMEDRREQAGEKRRELEQRMAGLRAANQQRVERLTAAREKLRLRHPTASFGKWDQLLWREDQDMDTDKDKEENR